jgi:hypothetical protein
MGPASGPRTLDLGVRVSRAVFAFFLVLATHQVSQAQELRVEALPEVVDNLAPEPHTDFALTLGFTPERFDLKVRRLRSVGWSLAIAGLASFVASFPIGRSVQERDDEAHLPFIIGGSVVGAGLALVGAVLLIRARRLITRRARWRASNGISLVEPRWDFRLGLGSAEWSLSF